MSERVIKWSLFALICATMPVVFYLVVVGGYLPLFAILVIALQNPTDPSIFGFCLVHFVFYGTIFYLLAKALAKFICSVTPHNRTICYVLSLLVLLAIGALPIFGAGHGNFEGVSAYRIYIEWQRLR